MTIKICNMQIRLASIMKVTAIGRQKYYIDRRDLFGWGGRPRPGVRILNWTM